MLDLRQRAVEKNLWKLGQMRKEKIQKNNLKVTNGTGHFHDVIDDKIKTKFGKILQEHT